MDQAQKTVFYDRHAALGAKFVEFGGWEMPMEYAGGIIQEHLSTRKHAGLFDVSHMGRFLFDGKDALPFLQHVLSNDAGALAPGESQYTLIPNENGGAIDDAYLYRFRVDDYLLVVNASNREKVWRHFQTVRGRFDRLDMTDQTGSLAMVSLQGPESADILRSLIDFGHLPEPRRNALSIAIIQGSEVLAARTGYTGEPVCFELFMQASDAPAIWDLLAEGGATPVGLGARDTLRLEAGLPLYGHELGKDPQGREIPIFACPPSRFAVSFSSSKGRYIGRGALERQFEELRRITDRRFTDIRFLFRRIVPVAMVDRGVARAGNAVSLHDRQKGWVTSGTMVPYWKMDGPGVSSRPTEHTGMRAIGLALIDSSLGQGDVVSIDIRGRKAEAILVPGNLQSDTAPYARAILYGQPA